MYVLSRAHGRHAPWDGNEHYDFSDKHHQQQPQQRHEQHHSAHRREHDSDSRDHRHGSQQHPHEHPASSPKYAKPRASGATITPGASLNYSSDTHLKHAVRLHASTLLRRVAAQYD